MVRPGPLPRIVKFPLFEGLGRTIASNLKTPSGSLMTWPSGQPLTAPLIAGCAFVEPLPNEELIVWYIVVRFGMPPGTPTLFCQLVLRSEGMGSAKLDGVCKK